MDKIPSFKLKDENGQILDSKFLDGMHYVLCFIPDDSEESVRQLDELDAIYQKLMVRNMPILTILPIPCEKLYQLMNDHGLRIKMLYDSEGFANSLGIEGRTSFIVARDGTFMGEWYNVPLDGHVSAIYDKVKSVLK